MTAAQTRALVKTGPDLKAKTIAIQGMERL